jgi:hypothetical protein
VLATLRRCSRAAGQPLIPCTSQAGLASRAPQFLHNVSINLKDGGYFVGTVPDGIRINHCIAK